MQKMGGLMRIGGAIGALMLTVGIGSIPITPPSPAELHTGGDLGGYSKRRHAWTRRHRTTRNPVAMRRKARNRAARRAHV